METLIAVASIAAMAIGCALTAIGLLIAVILIMGAAFAAASAAGPSSIPGLGKSLLAAVSGVVLFCTGYWGMGHTAFSTSTTFLIAAGIVMVPVALFFAFDALARSARNAAKAEREKASSSETTSSENDDDTENE